MATREKSIELLNKGVAKEIETVLQYIYFQAHFEDKGYTHVLSLSLLIQKNHSTSTNKGNLVVS